MKKVLFVLYAYKPFENANTNVVLPLISEMKKQYEIHIVSLNVDNSALYSEIDENIHIYRYKAPGKIKRILLQLYYTDPNKHRKGINGLVIPFGHWFSSILIRFGILRHNEYILLKGLIQKNDYYFTISTCESFVSCLNVLMLKKKNYLKCPWIVYFMDPFARYIDNVGSKKYWKQEMEVYEKADRILVTEEIYEQNKKDDFSKFLYKTRAVKFCNFKIPNAPEKNTFQLQRKSGPINCVYAGSLINDKIRDPYYLFRIINSLRGDFLFHLILYRVPKDRLNQYKKIVSNTTKVIWYDTLSLKETKKIVASSDILINLGNKVENQTPSKVFDYIATGKPIVNFISIENDSSLKYLKDYSFCLNIYEDDERVMENTQAFVRFCMSSKDKRVSNSQLRLYYSSYEQENAVKQFMKEIDEVI